MQIKKRQGYKVNYDRAQLEQSISPVVASSDELEVVVNYCDSKILALANTKSFLTIEELLDLVHNSLVELDYKEAAKKFEEYREERKKVREAKKIKVDVESTIEDYVGQLDWRVNENANQGYSVGGMILNSSGKITANYWLSSIYPEKIGQAHRDGRIHIHDLSFLGVYCLGHNLKTLLDEGLNGVKGHIESKPPKNLSGAIGQMVNALGMLQNEAAGAQAYSSADTYLAPFVRELKKNITQEYLALNPVIEQEEFDSLVEKKLHKEVYQCIQELIFNLNVPTRWGSQTPFTNLTFDLNCPEDLKKVHPKIGGVEVKDYTYGDLQEEINLINNVFVEVYIKGDKNGQPFTFPIPTYNITSDFDWNSHFVDSVFEMAAKYGLPYFQNFINSDMKPTDVRSMCPLTGDTEVLVKSGDNIAIRQIEDLFYENKVVKVWTGKQWSPARPNKSEDQKVYQLVLSNGTTVKMGEYHLQPILRGKTHLTVSARDIQVDDWIPFNRSSVPVSENVDIKVRTNQLGKSCDLKLNDDYYYYRVEAIEEVELHRELFCLEVNNDSHLFMLANGMITHNCRLRLDKRELLKRGNGLFGSAEQTGSIGVVTINLARLGFKHKNDKEGLYKELEELLQIAKDSLEIKRAVISKLLQQGFYPSISRYLSNFNNHFSTIGINGGNEMIRNFTNDEEDITTEFGQSFMLELMDYLRDRVATFQEETGNLWNVEASPAEGAMYRFALADKKSFGDDIIQAGTKDAPYYTNSSQLPVNFTDDIFEALDLQNDLQCKYTGGTVLHLYLAERLSNAEVAKNLIRKIFENYTLPYITLTPTFSICPKHGYLAGEHQYCPICDSELLEQSKKTI